MDCTVFSFLGGCRRATRELASERGGTADLALRLPFVPCFTRSAKLVPRKRRATSQCAFFQSSQRCGLSVKFWEHVNVFVQVQAAAGSTLWYKLHFWIFHPSSSMDGSSKSASLCGGQSSTASTARFEELVESNVFFWVPGSSSLIGLGGINALFVCRSRCRNQPHLLPRHLHLHLLRLQPLQNLHLQQAGNLM